MSEILAGEKEQNPKVCDQVNEQQCNFEISVGNISPDNQQGCSCMKKNVKVSEIEDVGTLISTILKQNKANKTKIKLQIEFE